MRNESTAPGDVSRPTLLRELLLALALTAGMGAMFGKAFVSGDTNGITYTPERCADFLSYFPDAGSCEAAATEHHFDEVVSYRVAAAVPGLIVLAAWWFLRRRFARPGRPVLLPGIEPAVGAALFGVAALGLMGTTSARIVFGGSATGAGEFLSGGIVSLVAFEVYALRTWRALALAPAASPQR